MLKNAPTLAIVAVHTEENEPPRILISNITNIYIHYLEPRERFANGRLLNFKQCRNHSSETRSYENFQTSFPTNVLDMEDRKWVPCAEAIL